MATIVHRVRPMVSFSGRVQHDQTPRPRGGRDRLRRHGRPRLARPQDRRRPGRGVLVRPERRGRVAGDHLGRRAARARPGAGDVGRGGRRRHPSGGGDRFVVPRPRGARRPGRRARDPPGGRGDGAAPPRRGHRRGPGARGRRQRRPREPGHRRRARSAPRPTSSPATARRSSGACKARVSSACAKHYPGHGSTHTDSHLALPDRRRPGRGAARARPGAVPRGGRGRRAVRDDGARRVPRVRPVASRPRSARSCWGCCAASWVSTGW